MGSLLAPDFWILQIFHKFLYILGINNLIPKKNWIPF